MGEMITIDAIDGSGQFQAYCARPAGTPKAAIIVIQEIFGVNPGIRQKADDWAAKGYLAIAPDMFWRFAPGFDADPDIPDQMRDAFEIRKQFDPDKGVVDIEATIRTARARLSSGGKVGVVGFCLGGRMAYLTATRTDIDASVSYYGAGIDAKLSEANAIANPLMLHYAGEDKHIPADVVATVHTALNPNPHVTIFEYPGVDHGFATTSGTRRNDAAARQADERTETFFAKVLG